MKIRNGFVSNSSSSSFLLVLQPSQRCACCGLLAPDFISKLDDIQQSRGYSHDTCINAIGREGILHYLRSSANTELIELVRTTSIHPDEQFAYVNIGYHEKELNELINHSKDIRVLYREGD